MLSPALKWAGGLVLGKARQGVARHGAVGSSAVRQGKAVLITAMQRKDLLVNLLRGQA